MIPCFIFGGLSILFCIIFCILRVRKANGYSLTFKTLASLSFIMTAISGTIYAGFSASRLFIIIGLVFGLAGDILLDLKVMYPEKNDPFFISGTISFFVGHISYLASVLLHLIEYNKVWLLPIALAIGIIAMFVVMGTSGKLKLNFGKHANLAGLYTAILSTMVALTVLFAFFVPIYWVLAIGMILFISSDLILSIQYFGEKNTKFMVFANHILYYLAQVIIAIFVLAF